MRLQKITVKLEAEWIDTESADPKKRENTIRTLLQRFVTHDWGKMTAEHGVKISLTEK